MVIVANPRNFKIPDWFLNRQKDVKDGRYSQVTSSALDTKLRDDLERLKKIRYDLALLLPWGSLLNIASSLPSSCMPPPCPLRRGSRGQAACVHHYCCSCSCSPHIAAEPVKPGAHRHLALSALKHQQLALWASGSPILIFSSLG